jgi:V/A-type H+-transporting ATPase subunit I
MAIARMTKVMLVSHRSQVSDLLEMLQHEGICQILSSEEASVSKDTPELITTAERPKDIEELIGRLDKALAFLKKYIKPAKGLANMLAPLTVVDTKSYQQVITDKEVLDIAQEVQDIQIAMDRRNSEIENVHSLIEMLQPWAALETPVEQIGNMQSTTCWAGFIPSTRIEQVKEEIIKLDAALEVVGDSGGKVACIVAALNANAEQVQKMLRGAEFEVVNFEPMKGVTCNLIKQNKNKLTRLQEQLRRLEDKAINLAGEILKIQILDDHYKNLLERENAKGAAPATESAVLLEAWLKKEDMPRLEKIVSEFDAVSMVEVKPAEGEEVPVEIENKGAVKPFEVITRLYGMPKYFEVDPTGVLAPFFAIFFGLCLTDAGYGLVILALMIYLAKKVQGDKKLMWLMAICSIATVVAGALTGGWFGDAIQKFIPALGPVRERMMWFDPLEKPMIFFQMSLVLGYFQIMVGLTVGFIHGLRRKDILSAVFDYLVWLVMLNSLVLFIAAKLGILPASLGTIFGYTALVPAIGILLFSERQGGIGARLGMGLYNLFSTIFYMGDVLSYLRLMALGMVTAGLAMAINVITEIAGQIPYIGIPAMILVFVGGHLFNLAINALGAFVHTLRLQYVEFFPKFLVGGGKSFEPLSKKYKHIYLRKEV